MAGLALKRPVVFLLVTIKRRKLSVSTQTVPRSERKVEAQLVLKQLKTAVEHFSFCKAAQSERDEKKSEPVGCNRMVESRLHGSLL